MLSTCSTYKNISYKNSLPHLTTDLPKKFMKTSTKKTHLHYLLIVSKYTASKQNNNKNIMNFKI